MNSIQTRTAVEQVPELTKEMREKPEISREEYTRYEHKLRGLILELPITAIEPCFDILPGLLRKRSAGEGSNRLDWEEDDRWDVHEYGPYYLFDDIGWWESSAPTPAVFFDGKYSDSSLTQKTPDVILTQVDGEWEATSPLSRLLVEYRLNPAYPKGSREYWIFTVMLRGLDERLKNLCRLAEFVARQQEDFFRATSYAEARKKSLRFIPQQDAAEALGLKHRGVISRMVKDKWVQIEPFDNIILPLKYFFPDARTREKFSDEELLEIIREEKPENPHVAEYIAEVLLKGRVTGRAIRDRLKKLGIPASARKRRELYQKGEVTWDNEKYALKS